MDREQYEREFSTATDCLDEYQKMDTPAGLKQKEVGLLLQLSTLAVLERIANALENE